MDVSQFLECKTSLHNQLVHSANLKCSHFRLCFMLFIPIHIWDCQTRPIQLLWWFDGRWQKRFLKLIIKAPICGLSPLSPILILLWLYLCLKWLHILSYLLVFFHLYHLCLASTLCHLAMPMQFISEIVVTKIFFLEFPTIHK